MQKEVMNLRDHVDHAISQVDEGLNPGDLADMDEMEKINVQKLYRETLHQCYNFGFEVSLPCTGIADPKTNCRNSTKTCLFLI